MIVNYKYSITRKDFFHDVGNVYHHLFEAENIGSSLKSFLLALRPYLLDGFHVAATGDSPHFSLSENI